MSSWVMTDETPTATVVWMAAEQIGKTQNSEQLQKICDYLINKHWFQTAGDLRSARHETTEWQALEVPGRLKLAIQHVLDQIVLHYESVPAYGYEDYYAAVCPSVTPVSDTTTQDWVEATTGYESAEAMPDYDYNPPKDATTDSTTPQYGYDQTDFRVSDPPSYEESIRATYENYDSYSTSLTVAEQSQSDERDVVEARVVEAETAEECDESEFDHSSYAVELGEPSQRDSSETSGTWSCGQCTYLNPMTSSFCDVCVGHISLSLDVKMTAATSVSASLLVPTKSVVDRGVNSSQPDAVQSPQTSVTYLLAPVDLLYPPSAPDFEGSDTHEDEPVDASPLPPPRPIPGTSSCDNVDFLALAFSAPTTQAQSGRSTIGKTSQMRREEITEHTF